LAGWFFLYKEGEGDKFVAGLLIGFASLIKQSNGGVALVVATVYVIFIHWKEYKHVLAYIFGITLQYLLVFLPIIYENLVIESYVYIIFHAANNKGGGVGIFYNWFKGNFYSLENTYMFISHSILLIICLKLLGMLRRWGNIIVLTILMLCVGKALWNLEFVESIDEAFWRNMYMYCGYFPLLGFGIILFKKIGIDAKKKILLATLLNFSLVFGSGMSGGLTKTSIFLTVGFIILSVIEYSRHNKLFILIVAICVCPTSYAMIKAKYKKPYEWWGYSAGPVSHMDFKLEENVTYKDLINLKHYLDECSVSPKSLMAYPHMAMVNIVTKIRYYEKAPVFWFDFMSDSDAQEVLVSLIRKHPDIIILWEVPEIAYEAHSRMFKNGRNLIHQDIYKLITSQNYTEKYKEKKVIISGGNYRMYIKKNLECGE
jgi:hypothetical protein